MSNKTYGLNYERKEKKYWESVGYTVMRSRGSFGLFDLIVVGRHAWHLISVKSTKQKYYSYKKEQEQIVNFVGAPKGTVKQLILYHKGKRKQLYNGVI